MTEHTIAITRAYNQGYYTALAEVVQLQYPKDQLREKYIELLTQLQRQSDNYWVDYFFPDKPY